MSNWIHIAGNIRFDSSSLKRKEIKEIENIKKVLGEIPKGSEGPLDIRILDIIPPDEDECGMCSARWSVNITGDLRDINNFSQIEKWVKEIKKRCIEENMWIRQGVIMAKKDNNIESKAESKTWELLTIYNKK